MKLTARNRSTFLTFLGVGLLVACVTILLNFLVVVKILHLDVSRYLGFLLPM